MGQVNVIHRRLARALIVAGIALVVAAPLADAHVTVNPGEAPKGGFAKLAFRVPTERDDAGTTAATRDDVDSANLLGIVGIVVGALGLLVGGIALFRRRSA